MRAYQDGGMTVIDSSGQSECLNRKLFNIMQVTISTQSRLNIPDGIPAWPSVTSPSTEPVIYLNFLLVRTKN